MKSIVQSVPQQQQQQQQQQQHGERGVFKRVLRFLRGVSFV